MTTDSAAAPAARRSRLAATIALVVLAVGPLLPTLRATFVYDDTTIIRDNIFLRGWSALAHVWSQPYWPGEGVDALGLYRPLHIALLSAAWNAGGGSPVWMHVYALLLAALATTATWWLLRRSVGGVAAFAAVCRQNGTSPKYCFNTMACG